MLSFHHNCSIKSHKSLFIHLSWTKTGAEQLLPNNLFSWKKKSPVHSVEFHFMFPSCCPRPSVWEPLHHSLIMMVTVSVFEQVGCIISPGFPGKTSDSFYECSNFKNDNQGRFLPAVRRWFTRGAIKHQMQHVFTHFYVSHMVTADQPLAPKHELSWICKLLKITSVEKKTFNTKY